MPSNKRPTQTNDAFLEAFYLIMLDLGIFACLLVLPNRYLAYIFSNFVILGNSVCASKSLCQYVFLDMIGKNNDFTHL